MQGKAPLNKTKPIGDGQWPFPQLVACRAYAADYAWTGLEPPHVCTAREPAPADQPTNAPDASWSLAQADRQRREYSVLDYPAYCESPLLLVTPPPGVLLNRQWDGYSAAVGLAQVGCISQSLTLTLTLHTLSFGLIDGQGRRANGGS